MSKLIGAYTVVQALVRDGEAYLAKSADGRSCTLRVVDVPEDDERLERVRAETLACAALHHPAVGVIADVFAHDGKTAIVGPEPVDGVLLNELLEKVGSKKLSDSEIWYIGMQIAAAVSLAHSTEVDGDFIPVCHGHLSPSQVSIGYDGTVRVEGIGLGHLVGEPGLVAEDGYTAPEQRGGGRITPRGDIYSVAAILWQMLAGTPPRESISLSDVAASVPDSFMDAFGRALESKVSKRRITSMELEQFLGELVDISSPGQGKKALGASMMVFKKGRTLLGHTHAARTADKSANKEAPNLVEGGPITQRGGTRKLGGAIGGRSARASGAHKVPPIRSKQSTLTGSTGTPRARMDSLPIDWDAASKSASDTVSPPALDLIDDELSWGADADDNLADLVPTPPPPGEGHAIADEDSDEEMTMMNPAGVELRAAMDEAKAKRDDVRGKRQSKRKQEQEETTLVRSRRRLERAAAQEKKRDAKLASLTQGDSDPPEGEELTVMRDEPEISLSEDSVPPAKSSGSGVTAPPRPRPSNRSLPRASDPGRLGDRDSRPDSKADLTRTLASAGVDEDELEQPPSEPQPATKKAAFDDEDEKTKPVAKRVIDIGAPRGTLPSELDSAVIPLPAAPDSRPSDDEGERDSSPIELDRPNRVEPAPAPVAKAASAIASKQGAGTSVEAQAPSTTSNAPSPWDKDDASDKPEPPGPKPIPTAMAALIIVVTMVVVMVIGVLVLRETSSVGPAPSLPPDLASGAAAKSGAAKPAAPKPTSKPRPSASAAGSAKASSAPSGALAPPDVEPSALPMTMGYLTVIYKPDPEAIVSVLGKDIGKVGVPNQVLCTRPSFVRLKTGSRWVNEGQTVTVKCRAITTIEVK